MKKCKSVTIAKRKRFLYMTLMLEWSNPGQLLCKYWRSTNVDSAVFGLVLVSGLTKWWRRGPCGSRSCLDTPAAVTSPAWPAGGAACGRWSASWRHQGQAAAPSGRTPPPPTACRSGAAWRPGCCGCWSPRNTGEVVVFKQNLSKFVLSMITSYQPVVYSLLQCVHEVMLHL